jgi:CheY-like chemotaxis protein
LSSIFSKGNLSRGTRTKVVAEVVNEAHKQNRILFVDDDPVFLGTIGDLFSAWSHDAWHIHRANSADRALEILKTEPMDLVVVDANMPVLDGVQFLRILSRRHPDLKKVMLTGLATEEKRSECLANGAELFIEKPRSADGLRSVFVMLDELMTWKPREGFQGMLRKVGLQDVIQMECLGRNSCVLEINNPQASGRLYIEDGSLTHAIVGNTTGEKALQKLLSFTGGSFQLLPFEPPPQRTINGPWEFLLMEAARVRDETAQKGAEGAEPAATVNDASEVAANVAVIETLVCSEKGELLYEWQCADVIARLVLLQNIAQQAAAIAQEMPFGNFDRLELSLEDGRAVAQTRADRLVFVRVTNEAINAPPAEAAKP